MRTHRVISASVSIHAGVLGLEPHQAQARLHRLKPCGGNRYEIIDPPVMFKRGELVDYEGELPKSLTECVTPGDTVVIPQVPPSEPALENRPHRKAVAKRSPSRQG